MKKALLLSFIVSLMLSSCTLRSVTAVSEYEQGQKSSEMVLDTEEKTSLVISTINKTKEVIAEDGTLLATVSVSYPVISGSENPYIAKINSRYEQIAMDYFEDSLDCKEYADEIYNERKEYFTPLSFELTYREGINRDGYLSFTNTYYEYAGGVHPNTAFVSENYDLKNEKMLTLNDILTPDVNEKVREAFTPYLEEIFPDYFETSWAKYFEEELENVNFALTDTSLELYFNAYDVGPYAMGAPMVEIEYDEENFIIKL